MNYFINKTLYLLIVFVIAISGVFVLVNNMPGDPAYGLAVSIAQQRNMQIEQALEIAHKMMGIDPHESIFVRYGKFVSNLLKGNFGYSAFYNTSVNEIIAKSLPWTLFVISLATFLSFTIGIFLGAFAAQKRATITEGIISTVSSIIQAIPPFILAVLILFVFSVRLKVLPLGGAYPVDIEPSFSLEFISKIFLHALGPMLAIAIPQMASWTLAMRGNTSQIMEEDFIRFAEARGLRDSVIAAKYVRNNAMLPLVASLAISVGYMLGGQTLVESIFNYPGIGFYFGKAIAVRDFGLLTGLFTLIVIGVILATFIADFVYALIDPRVKLK
ncbi:peptide/nickel transport system permease protein [Thermoanaerobacter thermohydrosulfuricus]|uniref:ABC-type dipeptide/oligopeptide/nickel transport systems, permease components n=2 Tax=Thermoanaerobacter thermohydrosulfuricus TaxID=1516 RepID=M8CLH7_THETY|nr:ABC transporter permease [Thermoanaerobacter thermohydrosulfuricus]EMT38085.1 ABC-type dipeptide/oligopeptide/nickel transport systems, permease components [Thermoanaerobacter thermohydrosulfuricus WC1]SDF93978.1 peptide/nickel transport system permease protein [Thermoanaerobacter thermohydrosulfuricus]SFE60570.1 peptide/nickel transport system permease protein [Thermoanaerobacter thermohydrosulfuricus]